MTVVAQQSEQAKIEAANKRIQELVARAYREGYSKGFETGVAAACGAVPAENERVQ